MNSEPEIIRGVPPFVPPPPISPPRRRQRPWINIVLFVLTFFSAMWSQVATGTEESGALDALLLPFRDPHRLLSGLPFALTLMAILLAHEMGHYITARRNGVDQTLPYFIPAPTLFGTLGAVILMRTMPKNRQVLLNVAVMGPYAGLVLAVPAAAWGLAHSTPIDPQGLDGGISLGSSLLFQWLENNFSPNGTDVLLHPVGFAGWVGLFVTSLNLIPAAQLDGGHVAYALFGRHQERVSLAVVLCLFGLGMFLGLNRGTVWVFWALLLFVIGIRHPPVRDETARLTRTQKLNGALALVVFVLTFIPVPIQMSPQAEPREPPTMDTPTPSLPPIPPPADLAPESPPEEFKL